MDKTVLTLAVDSTQVGTAAAAFDRMVNAGNAAATSAGKVTSTALAQGRAIGQTLVPALTRGAAGARTLAEAQKALGEDATRQVSQPAGVRPRVTTPVVAPVPQSTATGRAVPTAIPTVGADFGQLPGAASSAQSAIDRLTAAARSNRAALVQLNPAADAAVRSFRQLNATPIRLAAPQGLSTVAAVLSSAARVNPNPLREVAAAWADTADEAARAASTISQANRAIGAAPRGVLTQAGAAPRAPLSAQEIISSATGQRISTAAGVSTSEMTVEASRAQGAIERLTNAARDQRSALAQLAPTAAATADAYRDLAATPTPFGGFAGPAGIPGAGRPLLGGAPAGSRPSQRNGGQGGDPTPNGGGQGPDFGSTSAQLQQLSFQLNDFFVQVASGGSALTALIQQGSQLAGTYGGVRPAFQAVLALLTPIRVAAGGAATAVGALGYAFYQGSQQSKAFADAIVQSGNYAGQTEGQFNALARQVAFSSQATVGAAREAAQALIGTGQVGPQVFAVATEAVARYADATGKSADEVAKYFAAMGQAPAKWAEEHNKSTGFITAAQYEQIKAFEDAGRAADAQGVIYSALNERLRKLTPNLTGLDRALMNSKKAWSAFWDAAFDNTGRENTIEGKISALVSKVQAARSPTVSPTGDRVVARPTAAQAGAAELELQDQLMGQAREQANAQNEAAKTEANRAAIAANAVVEGYTKRAKAADQYKQKLDELKRAFSDKAAAGVPVSAEDQKIARAQLAKDFAPAKGLKNNDASQILAAQLQTDLRRISDAFEAQRDAYEFQNEFVEAAYRNGNISLGTLLDQRRQAIEDSARAEIASLDKEAARLQQYLATVKDGSERTQVQGQIEEVGAERSRVELRASRDVVLLNQEAVASYRALNDQVANYRANLLQMQGDEAGAAALRAQAVITNARMLAAQAAGIPGAPVVDVAGLERAIAVTDQFNEVQRQTSLLAGNSARAEEAFALAAEQSGRSLVETERGIYEIRVEELKQLGALAAKARELAEASTDPRIKAFAADLALEYAKAADAIDPALNRLRDASRQLAAGIANTAGQAPNSFAQEYTRRRTESSDEVKREREVYTRRIEMLEGYLATTRDKNDQARLRERIKQEEDQRDGLKGESRGSSALNAINDAVLQPMAEQVFNTVNKLLITDPLQKYLEGQLKGLTEGGGMLAGFFKDALGIQADPKDLALQQQTAAITASTSALDVLANAAQNAATALTSRSPASAALAGQAPVTGSFDPSQPPPVDAELAGVQSEAAESVLEFSRSAASATSDLAQLANAANVGGGAMARLPGIIGLFQSAVALLTTKSSAESGSSIFGAIAGMFGASAGAGSYEAAVASTGIFHSGGIVGQPPASRNVSMSVFAGAPRYHTGGIVGQAADKAKADLKPNEVAAILMGGPKGQREEVITADDPRHRDNLGMSIVARIMNESRHEGLKVRGARELGGPVSARSMYRVNEKGPELLQVAGKQYLMTGAQGGKVVPDEGGGKEDRPVVINNNFALSGPASQASQAQIAGMAARGVKRGMRNT